MKCIFGIDLGGTQIKIGKFIDGKLVLKYAIDTDVSDNGKNIINDICVTIEKNLNSDTLIGIGIDVPGPAKDGWVLGAQNIGWKSVNVKGEISNRFPNVLVEVLNDANAALYGEYYCGGAKGYKNVVMRMVHLCSAYYADLFGSAIPVKHVIVYIGSRSVIILIYCVYSEGCRIIRIIVEIVVVYFYSERVRYSPPIYYGSVVGIRDSIIQFVIRNCDIL